MCVCRRHVKPKPFGLGRKEERGRLGRAGGGWRLYGNRSPLPLFLSHLTLYNIYFFSLISLRRCGAEVWSEKAVLYSCHPHFLSPLISFVLLSIPFLLYCFSLSNLFIMYFFLPSVYSVILSYFLPLLLCLSISLFFISLSLSIIFIFYVFLSLRFLPSVCLSVIFFFVSDLISFSFLLSCFISYFTFWFRLFSCLHFYSFPLFLFF